jgi:hypothetical protein
MSKLTAGLAALILVTASLGAAEELHPGDSIRLEFPDLPPTFLAMKTGQPIVPQLTVRLPEDYVPSRRFPLFVFIQGGDGGRGDADVRQYIGDRGFITANLPLFVKSLTPPPTAVVIPEDLLHTFSPEDAADLKALAQVQIPGIVSADDAPVLTSSWAAMLQKLNARIPNIDPEQSVIAGFSNGGHAIGYVLAGRDPFLRRNFHSFAMIEGGVGAMLDGNAWLTPDLAGSRILVMFSDSGKNEGPQAEKFRPLVLKIVKRFIEQATERRLDSTLEVMSGAGHMFPPDYQTWFKTWCAEKTALGGRSTR